MLLENKDCDYSRALEPCSYQTSKFKAFLTLSRPNLGPRFPPSPNNGKAVAATRQANLRPF